MRAPHQLSRLTLASIALLAVGAVACTKKDAASDSAAAVAPTDTAALAPAPAPAAPAMNDAQIAHVAVTANSIDSAAGVVAQKKGASQAVKDFGKMMVTDHGGVNKKAVALATKLNVTPEDNDVSRSLQQGATASKDSLAGLTGAAFDRAYIDREVGYHQAVLDALDKTLIPQSQNAELKQLLQDVRPAVAAHLERAKQIQGTLASK